MITSAFVAARACQQRIATHCNTPHCSTPQQTAMHCNTYTYRSNHIVHKLASNTLQHTAKKLQRSYMYRSNQLLQKHELARPFPPPKYVRHDLFRCVTWLINKCATTHWYLWHASSIATRWIHIFDDDCFYYHLWRHNVVVAFGIFWSFHIFDVTPSDKWQESFIGLHHTFTLLTLHMCVWDVIHACL